MEQPFLVLATQNPIEYEGTFPLPEAQLDRFMMRINLGYPDDEAEVTMLDRQQHTHPVTRIEQVVSSEELVAAQEEIKEIYLNDLVKEYIVRLVTGTRKHPDVYLGASPRGSIALYKTGQARAAILGRDYVTPDDIKSLAMVTLAHRLIISPSARIKNVDPRAVIQEILDSTPVPGARVRPR
jgi:MoxR-like ATPase